MASSGDVHEDVSPRLLPTLVKGSDKQSQKKDFDVRLSRMSLTNSDTKESMLAYSEHMRQINHGRKIRPTDVTQLALRAHHVPKHTSSLTSHHRRKSMSLNELIDRRKNPISDRRQNVNSARSLPSFKVAHLPPKHLRISFVSASDLHDILDCNFKSKGTRSEGLRLSLWDSGTSLSWMNEKHRADPPIRNTHEPLTMTTAKPVSVHPSPEKKFKSDFPLLKQDMPPHETLSSSRALPLLQQIHAHQHSGTANTATHGSLVNGNGVIRHSVLRHRPRRAKRMTLHRPELGVIPESDGDGDGAGKNKSHIPSRSSLEAIKGTKSNSDKRVNISFVECNFESLIGASSSHKPGTEPTLHMPLSGLPSAIRPKYQPVTFPGDNALNDKEQNSQANAFVVMNALEDRIVSDKETVANGDEKALSVSKTNKSKATKRMNKLIFLRDYPDKHYHRK